MCRYGDPINPFGDLESVGRARCLLKEKDILMIGIPVGLDSVVVEMAFFISQILSRIS